MVAICREKPYIKQIAFFFADSFVTVGDLIFFDGQYVINAIG